MDGDGSNIGSTATGLLSTGGASGEISSVPGSDVLSAAVYPPWAASDGNLRAWSMD